MHACVNIPYYDILLTLIFIIHCIIVPLGSLCRFWHVSFWRKYVELCYFSMIRHFNGIKFQRKSNFCFLHHIISKGRHHFDVN